MLIIAIKIIIPSKMNKLIINLVFELNLVTCNLLLKPIARYKINSRKMLTSTKGIV